MLFINYKLFLVVRKSRKNRRHEKDVFFEIYIELFAGCRLCCGDIHSIGRLHWTKNKLDRDKKYFG
jgi:hypothetical protein